MTEPYDNYYEGVTNICKEEVIRSTLSLLSKNPVTFSRYSMTDMASITGSITLICPAGLPAIIHVFIGRELLGLILLPEGSNTIDTDIIKDFLSKVPLADEDSDYEFPKIIGNSDSPWESANDC